MRLKKQVSQKVSHLGWKPIKMAKPDEKNRRENRLDRVDNT